MLRPFSIVSVVLGFALFGCGAPDASQREPLEIGQATSAITGMCSPGSITTDCGCDLACGSEGDCCSNAASVYGPASVAMGASVVCVSGGQQTIQCWGGTHVPGTDEPSISPHSTSVGSNEVCWIRSSDSTVECRSSTGQCNIPGACQGQGPVASTVAVGDGDDYVIASDGTVTAYPTGAAVPSDKMTSIDAGYGLDCGIRTNGTVVCWGAVAAAVNANAPATSFRQISVQRPVTGLVPPVLPYGTAVCGIDSAGNVRCWGSSATTASFLTGVPSGTFTKVVASQDWACALGSGGAVSCWGAFPPAVPVAPAGDRWVDVARNGVEICLSTATGSVGCSSFNPFGTALSPPYDTAHQADLSNAAWSQMQARQVVDGTAFGFAADGAYASFAYQTAGISNSAAFGNTAWGSDANQIRLVGDVTGDGLPDVVGFGADHVWVGVATSSSGLANKTAWTTGFTSGWSVTSHLRVLADFDQDKKMDIVGFGSGYVYAYRSTGSAFVSVSASPYFSYSQGWRVGLHPRYVRDVTGDGYPDIVGFANAGVYVLRGSATGFPTATDKLEMWSSDFGCAINAAGACTNWTPDQPRFLADMNNDKKLDVVGFGTDGVWVAYSDGTKFGAKSRLTFDYGSTGGWSGMTRAVADLNGDGRPDLVGIKTGTLGGAFVSANVGGQAASQRWAIGGASSHGYSSADLYDVSSHGIVRFTSTGLYLSRSR